MLEGWLEYHRATLPGKCDGPDDEQRRHRRVATSLMSLHGPAGRDHRLVWGCLVRARRPGRLG